MRKAGDGVVSWFQIQEAMDSSASFLAEISVSSPRKIIIFIIYKNIFWMKVSKQIFNLNLKTEALMDLRVKQCLRSLFMCLVLFLPRVWHWCSLAVVKRNIVLSINAKMKSNLATATCPCIEDNKTNTMVKSSSQTDTCLGIYCMFCISWVYFSGNIPR